MLAPCPRYMAVQFVRGEVTNILWTSNDAQSQRRVYTLVLDAILYRRQMAVMMPCEWMS